MLVMTSGAATLRRMAKKQVVIGYLGSQLDGGLGPGRWEKWRPTISLVAQPDVVVHRLELFHAPQHLSLARQISEDVAKLSPETEVRLIPMPLEDPWDFGEVYATLFQHLGVDLRTTITDLNGRPQYLVEDDAPPLPELA